MLIQVKEVARKEVELSGEVTFLLSSYVPSQHYAYHWRTYGSFRSIYSLILPLMQFTYYHDKNKLLKNVGFLSKFFSLEAIFLDVFGSI
jgi:hypothetical protein